MLGPERWWTMPITLSLEPNVADLRYFKLWILLNQIIWVWNIKGLKDRVLKILRFKYLILFKRLNSYVFNAGLELIPSIINIYNYFHFCNSIREFFCIDILLLLFWFLANLIGECTLHKKPKTVRFTDKLSVSLVSCKIYS